MDRQKLIDDLCRVTGLTQFAWRSLRPGLYVFNYHRIGDAEQTPFDPNVFSCSEERLADHVGLLRSRFQVIGVERLLQLIEQGAPVDAPIAMITFDDAYRDNYTKALPVLRSTGTPGVFFVPTSYIGTRQVSWWDEVAWMVGDAKTDVLATVSWLQGLELSAPRARKIRLVLNAFKRSSLPIEAKLEQLRKAAGRSLDVNAIDPLFMNWDEVRSLKQAGMDVGSHTCSHRILGHLDPTEQRAELEQSKAILEKELGAPVHTIAYPVGTASTYTEVTKQLTLACGYHAAFSFVSGLNQQPSVNRFDLKRMSVDNNADAHSVQQNAVRVSLDINRYPGVPAARRIVRRVVETLRRY